MHEPLIFEEIPELSISSGHFNIFVLHLFLSSALTCTAAAATCATSASKGRPDDFFSFTEGEANVSIVLEDGLAFEVVKSEKSSEEGCRIRRGLLLLIIELDAFDCCGPDERSFIGIIGGDSEMVELGVAKDVDEIVPVESAKECQFICA